MATFINKKERVYDLKLTSYGHYLLSIGRFKPVYYAFYDNNVIYDGEYVGIKETQSEVTTRIKDETQYLESLVLFEDVEDWANNSLVRSEMTPEGLPPEDIGLPEWALGTSYFDVDITPTMVSPRHDSFRFTSIIGDAYLEGSLQDAPAWKVVSLGGRILSSSLEDAKNNIHIPQVNIQLQYSTRIEQNQDSAYMEEIIRDSLATSKTFADDKIVRLLSDDLMIYVEELNTENLTDNFDIEVFHLEEGSIPAECADCQPRDRLSRKYFPRDPEKIMGGVMTEASQDENSRIDGENIRTDLNFTTDSVGYFFDPLRDHEIDPVEACKASELFNKQSYYVDLDFDCQDLNVEADSEFIDIYGPVTEPEICP